MNDELGAGDGQHGGAVGGGRPAAPHQQGGQAFSGGTVQGPAGMARAGVPAGGEPGHVSDLRGTDGGAPVGGAPVGGPPAGGGEDGPAPGPLAPYPVRQPPVRRGKGKSLSWWAELPILLGFALVLALLIKTFIVQAFFIPSSSMENTLDIGDKVLVNKMVYDFRPIHRGDIVVFNGEGSWDPVTPQTAPPLVRLWNSIASLFGTAPGVHDYIKRVIGIPGDHVACCDALGRITVNGVPLNEKSYLYPGNAPSTDHFSVTVPAGRLWVMGDHRSVSYDSRGHAQDPGGGTIPVDRVVGRAFIIVAPVSRWRVLPIPGTFDQRRLAVGPAAAPTAGGGPRGLAGLVPSLSGFPAPAVPLGLGLTGAFPLTWLQRRLRRRLRSGRPRGRLLARRHTPREQKRPGRPGPDRPGPG